MGGVVVRRRKRGFERAGALPPSELGVPYGRGRQLVLSRAWREVAGELIAGRAPVLRLTRGVLEVGVPEGPWGRTLPDIVPGLVALLAARNRALGVKRYRLVSEEGGTRADALPLPPLAAKASPRRRKSREDDAKDEGRAEVPLDVRLREVMERYVARAGEDTGRRS